MHDDPPAAMRVRQLLQEDVAVFIVKKKYASHVHRRSQRAGHLFQGRLKHVLVEAEAHLHERTRSMHRNPVRAGLVTAPALYRWSSSHEYLGLRQPPTWLDLQQTLRHFGHEISQQRQRSQECVVQALVTNPLQSMVFGAVLGSKNFVATVRSRLQPTRDDREVAQLVKIRPGVPLSTICQVVQRAYGLQDADLRTKSRRGNEGRDIALYLARTYARRSLREIGDAMGPISPSAVSMASTRVVHKLSQHRALRQKIEHIVAEFGALGENIED